TGERVAPMSTSGDPAGPARRRGPLARVRADLSRGENLELYLTAASALVVGVLGIFDVVGGKAVGAATLAILALLAVSSLGSRHQLDDMRRAVTALADNATAQVPADRYLFLRAPPFVPTFGMCLLDPNHAQGRAFVELYLHKSLESHPVFVLRADRDGQRFRRFAQQFDVLWASGRPVPLAPE